MTRQITECDARLRELSEVRRTIRQTFDSVNTEGVEWVRLGKDIDALLDERSRLTGGTHRA
jgi:hypothetical protein